MAYLMFKHFIKRTIHPLCESSLQKLSSQFCNSIEQRADSQISASPDIWNRKLFEVYSSFLFCCLLLSLSFLSSFYLSENNLTLASDFFFLINFTFWSFKNYSLSLHSSDFMHLRYDLILLKSDFKSSQDGGTQSDLITPALF